MNDNQMGNVNNQTNNGYADVNNNLNNQVVNSYTDINNNVNNQTNGQIYQQQDLNSTYNPYGTYDQYSTNYQNNPVQQTDYQYNNAYNEYGEYSASSNMDWLAIIAILAAILSIVLAFFKYGIILAAIVLIFSILRVKTNNKLYYGAIVLAIIAIIISLLMIFNGSKTKTVTNDPNKGTSFISDAKGILEAVKNDVTTKGITFKIYTKEEIDSLTQGKYKTSPYNSEYDKISVSFIDNITSNEYNICLIDKAKNGFGYVKSTELNDSIVNIGTAPDNC